MRTDSTATKMITAAGVIALALAFSACRPKPPEAPPAPVPPAPEVSSPAGTTPPSASIEATDAPPLASATPQSPAPASRATAPDLSTMKQATASSKLGVAVDLRYQFDGAVEAGRPVTLHLAAVPRVPGSNLSVSIKEAEGIQTNAPALAAQKATAGTAYRQQVSVTRAAAAPTELRVLVTMETPEGSAFSWFGVPLAR
jgi:hypothetical protein